MVLKTTIGNKGSLVDRFINTSYDIVKLVADNIDAVIANNTFIDSGDAAAILTAQADTAADVVITNADVVITNADVIITNADVILTNADVVLTNADVVTVQGIYDQFDDRFLGSKAVDPTLDNDSNALIEGAMYWNSVSKEIRVWNGSAFVVSYNALTGISDSATAIALTIDSAENIGIGVTPKTFNTAYTSMQLGGMGALATITTPAATNAFYIANNLYASASNWNYIADGAMSVHSMQQGKHIFGSAAVGLADDTLTWTVALTLSLDGTVDAANSVCIKDDDTMADDSALHLVTQQSVKAYIDNSLGRGSVVYSTANWSHPTSGSTLQVPWDTESYDTDVIHDTGTNTERLVVPAGVTKVRLTAQIHFAANGTGIRYAYIAKNASGLRVPGMPYESPQGNVGTLVTLNLVSSVVEVVGGDYFRVFAYQSSGGALDVLGGTTYSWFSMEIIK